MRHGPSPLQQLGKISLHNPAARCSVIRHPPSRQRCQYASWSQLNSTNQPLVRRGVSIWKSRCGESSANQDATTRRRYGTSSPSCAGDSSTHLAASSTNSTTSHRKSFLFNPEPIHIPPTSNAVAATRSSPQSKTAKEEDELLEQLETDFLHSQGIEKSEKRNRNRQRPSRLDRPAQMDPYGMPRFLHHQPMHFTNAPLRCITSV